MRSFTMVQSVQRLNNMVDHDDMILSLYQGHMISIIESLCITMKYENNIKTL